MSIKDVANYFLYLSEQGTSKSITHLKLQKLVFYTQALSYVILKRELFKEDFEAWVHGPVSPDLYYEFKKYGSAEIEKLDQEPALTENDKKVVKAVWKLYGDKDGKYLENKTHNERPWKKARADLTYYQSSNKVIDKTDIRDYYIKKFIPKKQN